VADSRDEAKAAFRYRKEKADQYAKARQGHNLGAVEVAAIGNGIEMLGAECPIVAEGRCMTANEFRAALSRLGLSQVGRRTYSV
jgi:hypothetical protein